MTSYSKVNGISTFTKVNGISTWSKINGFDGVFNWATIYTYTTNATATTITNWVGSAISTSPNVPAVINGQPVVVTASSTFNGKTTLTNCYINANVAFSSNSMVSAFKDCTKLKTVDLIPNSVTNISEAFIGCENMVNAPVMGTNITNMDQTFFGCSKLVNVATIPNKVTTMYGTFYGCISLVTAPTIGTNVVNMHKTFRSCSKLAGNITVVNANVTNFAECFDATNASLAKNLRCPAGSVSYNLAINVCNGANGVTVVAY